MLSRSGYLLESRLETLLRKRDYYVEANSVYPDASTGKSRELDLLAIHGYKAGPQGDYIFAVLCQTPPHVCLAQYTPVSDKHCQ